MKYIYTLPFKDLQSAFNLFSYSAELFNSYLNFDITKDDLQRLDTSKIHFYEMDGKKDKQYFLLKVSNKLKELNSLSSTKSDLILSMKGMDKANKNSSLGKLVLSSIVSDLNSISLDKSISEAAKIELAQEYLATLTALYYNALFNRKSVNIALERELQTPSLNPLEEKLNAKSPIKAEYAGVNKLESLIEFKKENLEKMKLSEEIITKNFNWIIDENFLARSWENEEYSLSKIKENFSNIEQINDSLLSDNDFFAKVCDIFIPYLNKKIGQSYRNDKLEIDDDFFQNFNDPSTLKTIFNRFLNSPIFLEKVAIKENIRVLASIYNETAERYKNFRGSNVVDKALVEVALTNILSTKKGVEALAHAASLSEYMKFIPEEIATDLETVAIVIENWNKFKGNSTYNALGYYLEKVLKEKEKVTFDFMKTVFSHIHPQSLELNWEGRGISYEFFISEAITSEQIIELMELQFGYICAIIDLAEDRKGNSFKNRDDKFYNELLRCGKARINVNHEQSYKLFNTIKKVIPEEFFNDDKNIENFIACLGYSHYPLKNKDSVLTKYLLSHPEHFKEVLKIKPKMIEECNLDQGLYYKIDNLLQIGIFRLIDEASWGYSQQRGTGLQAVVFNLSKVMSISEQQKLIDTNALFYCTCATELKLNKANAIAFIIKTIAIRSVKTSSTQESWFHINKVPKELFSEREFCTMLLNDVMGLDCKMVAKLIPVEFWFNRDFILSFAKALDKVSSGAEILNYLPIDIKKFFTSFEIKSGENYSFLSNYFTRLDLSKDLTAGSAVQSTAKKSKI